jgi:hypothetical protein
LPAHHTNVVEKRKKSKTIGVNKDKKWVKWTSNEERDESESSQDESVVVVDCLDMEYKIIDF